MARGLLLLSLLFGSAASLPLSHDGHVDAPSSQLAALAFRPAQLGTVAPTGWMRRQLELQASGLSGHLNLFWPDVQDSIWIGGTQDGHGGLHERGPYWLNGVTVLASLLRSAGSTSAAAASVEQQSDKWIHYILSHRNSSSGWLGPDDGGGQDYWSGWNIVNSLLQYAEARSGTQVAADCLEAALRYCLEAARRMKTHPLSGWAQVRWQDWNYILQLLLDTGAANATEYAALMANMNSSQAHGFDWDSYYDRSATGKKFPVLGISGWNMIDHGVNNAMSTKSPAVQYRLSKNASESLLRAKIKHHQQMRFHGQPHGMFAADECLGGRHLNRGIELCAVVEQMYSLQALFRTFGDVEFLDRCERIAYNALPGTITPDMWQHQYLQLANELNAAYGESQHSWNADGPDSTGFGVEPNFGCCTANFNQGWPKLATNVVFTYVVSSDSAEQQGKHGRARASAAKAGVAVGIFLPASASVAIPWTQAVGNGQAARPAQSSLNVAVDVETEYPFGDRVTIKVTVPAPTSGPRSVPLKLRIPSWATAAKLSINSSTSSPQLIGSLKNGTMMTVPGCCNAGATTTVVLDLNPSIVVETGWGAELPSKSWPADENHTVEDGYGYFSGAAMNGGDLRHANMTFAEATAWCNSNPLCVSFTFSNKNLTKGNHKPTIPVSTYFKSMFVTNTDPTWSTWLRLGAPGFGHPTNAAAVVRGPLLFARRLDQKVATVKTWPPFNNTDQNITLDAAKTSAGWNHALVLNAKDATKYMKLAPRTAPGKIPFDIQDYPILIQARARKIGAWQPEGGLTAFAAEPPASPVDCTQPAFGCGADEVDVELVPYGATNIRLSGLPWIVANTTGHD